ncbi:MAG: phosphatase PAP2 family protein [Gammaproteobacteria bacterium]
MTKLDRRFWRNHALWPAVLFGTFAVVFATTGLDEFLARAWAFNAATGQFIGSGSGEWWAKDLVHSSGGLVVRLLGGMLLLLWVLSFAIEGLRRWRRPAGFIVLSVAAGAGLVGVLKQTTNVDCPWSLTEFGGDRPYVSLFSDRPDELPRGHCFPGGHSSSGFALFSLYFLFLFRHRRAARWALAAALLLGGLFAFAQEARGAHFLSHDVWSAALVWYCCLAIFALGYRGEVWSTRDESLASASTDRGTAVS